MPRKKTGAQLDREIAVALKGRVPSKRPKPSRHHARKADVSFTDLIREDDPSAMQVAEDFLLEKGWKLREVTGGLTARNFTIDMNALHRPRNEWKMVQVTVAPAGRAFPGQVLVDYSIANGPVRVEREETYATSIDAARKSAVATAWAIAKAIKPLPLDTPERTIKDVVNEIIDNGLDNMIIEDLY